MILYYTGTGNSRFIAEAAADFLANEVQEARGQPRKPDLDEPEIAIALPDKMQGNKHPFY